MAPLSNIWEGPYMRVSISRDILQQMPTDSVRM